MSPSRRHTTPPRRGPSPPKRVAAPPHAPLRPTTPHPSQDPRAAIDALIASHGDKLMGLALRLTRTRHDAEDLVQETFTQALRKWSTFRHESDPGTWLYTIAIRCWRKRAKRSARDPRSLTDLAPFTSSTVAALPLDRAASTEDIPATREAIHTMEQAIATLPDEFRLAIVLKDILELETEDVAAALRIKPQTVKTRVHRARLLLRSRLMRRVPQREAPAPIYARQVCIDLLRAKLDAMDAGRGFPVRQQVICERCLAVFAELDLTQSVCAELSEATLSKALIRKLRALATPPAQSPKDSGNRAHR